MTHTEAITIGRELLYYTLLLAMPALLVSLAVGLVISVFQAVTSIQEQTLTFVPRILAVGLLFIMTAPWMLELTTYFTTLMLSRALEVAH